MVLYKRKHIVLQTPKELPENLNWHVWYIKETGEWFITYEEYLERLSFYKKHFFTCEITGTSSLTFFDALNSEESQFKNVEEKFPLKLREPVARFLHFNEVRRLDLLVEQVYTKFKSDFFPGEMVYLRKSRQEATPTPEDFKNENEVRVSPNSGSSSHNVQHAHYRKPYIIKEKAQFNAVIDPITKKQISPAYSKYMLVEENGTFGSNYIISDELQIYRDRSTFTKHLLKCFCRITLRRASSKMGAPWCIKEEYLPIYGLSMEWPVEMLKYKEGVVDQCFYGNTKRTFDNNFVGMQGNAIQPTSAEDQFKLNPGKKRANKVGQTYITDVTSAAFFVREEETGKSTLENNERQTEKTALQQEVAPSITSVVEDLKLPYDGPHRSLNHVMTLSESLEYISLKDNQPHFRELEKLIQCYSFLNTFNEKLYIPYFTWDDFITSIRCTDISILSGKVVKVKIIDPTHAENGIDSDLEKEEHAIDSSIPISIRKYFNSKENRRILHVVEKSEPVDDDYLDAIKENGSCLLVECFVVLLKLFIDEQGAWKTVVMDNWYDDDVEEGCVDGKNDMGSESPSISKTEDNKLKLEKDFNSKDEINKLNGKNYGYSIPPEVHVLLEKCLNFREKNWSEWLIKRKLQNGFWIIILLGIYQDCMHLPMYTNFIYSFIRAVVPAESNSIQLNKILWINFCKNLSIGQKVTALWILVELCSNFSQDIKNAVEESMDLCAQIRSERYKIARDLRLESQVLSDLNDKQKHILESDPQSIQLSELMKKIERQTDILDHLKKDKMYLDLVLYENDLQRLKPLGMDRYANKYYWLELYGFQRASLDNDQPIAPPSSGRIWLQGPSSWDIEHLFGIKNNQVEKWLELKCLYGATTATKEVFNIYRGEDGCYKQVDRDTGIENILISADGVITNDRMLTSIQKKVIDETPEALLLSDSQWYCIDSIDDYNILSNRWNNWGRREHDLIKQAKNVEQYLLNSLKNNHECPNIKKLEKEFKKKLSEVEFTQEELDLSPQVVNELYEQSKEDYHLEAIAEKIIKLDNTSKTRKILKRIQELETNRDQLLAKKKYLEKSGKSSSRVQLRTESKRVMISRDNKIKKKEEILTNLINLPFTESQARVVRWANQLARKLCKVSLTRGTTGKTKVKLRDNVDTKLSIILKNTLKHQDSLTAT